MCVRLRWIIDQVTAGSGGNIEHRNCEDEGQMQGTLLGDPGACSPLTIFKKWCDMYLMHSRALFSHYNFDILRGNVLKIISLLSQCDKQFILTAKSNLSAFGRIYVQIR